MYKLYTRAGTGGFIVEAALALADAPFEAIDVPKTDNPEPAFLSISPLNQVPALVLADGRAITESAAICILLAQRHAEAGLAPAPGAPEWADFLRWMAFLSSNVYPAVLRFYHTHRYTADTAGIPAVRQAAVAELDRDFAIVDAALAGCDRLAGDRMSLADIYLLMLVSWHPDAARARAAWPNIERVCASLRPQPLMAKLNARHDMWAD